MGYLIDEAIDDIADSIKIVPLSEALSVNFNDFDCGVREYNDFLKLAYSYEEKNVSKTHLLVHKESSMLLGYITLSTDSIKLTQGEKDSNELNIVTFCSIPAIKIGKLAINKNVPVVLKRKGYGSFLIEWARGIAALVNMNGVACRFLTVDADIEYNKSTTDFYEKNGFKKNKANTNKKSKTVSMRLDIFNAW